MNPVQLGLKKMTKHIHSLYYTMTTTCNLCNKSFKSEAAMKQHKRSNPKSHSEIIKKLPCTNCNELFLTQASLNGHIASKHEHEKHECDNCDRVFSSLSELEKHIKLRYECSICYKSGIGKIGKGKRDDNVFCDLRDVSQHYCDKHGSVCPDCHKVFDTKEKVVIHIMDKHLSGKISKLVLKG